MKRVFSFLLALAMLLAMGIPVFADDSTPVVPTYEATHEHDKIISADPETENGVITISNAAVSTTYTAYKIFDADILPDKPADSLEGVTYTLEPDSEACELLFGTKNNPLKNDYFKYDWISHRVTASIKENLTTTDLAKYLQDLVKDNPDTFPHVSLTAVAPPAGEGAGKKEITLTFDGLQYGYYLIDRGTSGGVATLNSSAPTMNVVDKNQMPGNVDKEVKLLGETNYSDPSNTVNISDVVTYKIAFTATNYAGQEKIRYYEIHDVKGTGIWAEFNSFKVKIGGKELPGYYVNAGGDATDAWSHLNSWPEDETADIQKAAWYLVHKDYDEYSILIPWINEYRVDGVDQQTQTVVIQKDGTSKYDSPVEVEITYNATIEPNAAIGPNVQDNNNDPNLFNTAQLQWFGKYTNGYTNPDTVYSETFALSILKQGQAQGESAKPVLAGATFKVYKDQDLKTPLNVIPTGVDGVYIVDSEGTAGEQVSGARMDTARKYFEYLREPDGDHIGGTEKANWKPNEDLAKLYQRDEQGNLVLDDKGNPKAILSNEVVTAENGRLVILGLNLGTYYFEETIAPVGYNKLESSFPIEVTKNSDYNRTVSIYATADGSVVNDKNQGAYEYKYYLTDKVVENSKGAVLPSTGGEGRMMLISVGSMIAMAFAVLMITQKKMSVYKD